jgi:plasmid maintenance system killer protein
MNNEGVAVMSSNITNSSSNSSLDIINSSDEQFDEKFPEILKKVKLKKLQELEPSIDEINKVYSIIFKYIKENKRKIYGGYALNKLLIDKDKNLALYDETDIPDIDFYSPDPLSDLANLCELLHEGGFNSVEGREAQHKETYSIFVNYQLYCDISYMSNNIFSHVMSSVLY